MMEVPEEIKPPEGIELKISLVDKKRTGCFSINPVEKGTEFGPYEGRIVYNKDDETVDPRFSWEVFDLKTFKYIHTVDATDPDEGNWMRYVCCARYFEEQNIVSTQNGLQVYYRALKDIEAGEELLTWFQPKKKKRKRGSARNSIDTVYMQDMFDANPAIQSDVSDTTLQGQGEQKRRRKPKVIPDAYIGPLDWEEQHEPIKIDKIDKIDKEDVFEPLQPGQKRRRRKKLPSDNVSTGATSPSENKIAAEEKEDEIKPNIIEIKEKDFNKKDKEKVSRKSKTDVVRRRSSSSDIKKESGQALSIAEINNSVEWEFPKPGEEYNFELKKQHIVTEKGKKVYKCDICLGLYKHMFSLKRHYLRNHVNYKYLSKSDMTNCLINLAQVKQLMRKKIPDEINCTEDDNKSQKPKEIKIDNGDSKRNVKDESGIEDNLINENTDNGNKSEDDSENCAQGTKTSVQGLEGKDVNDLQERRVEESSSQSEAVSDTLNESGSANECDENNDICTSKTDFETTDGHQTESEEAEGNDTPEKAKDISSKGNITEENDTTDIKVEKQMPGLYRCYTCYLTFDDFERIREHTQNHPDQEDGACFPCDLCSMRFNYKHNLVRHKKTHETEDLSKKPSVNATDTNKDEEKPSQKKHLLPAKSQPPPEKKPLLHPSVFQCGVCPLKFDTQPKVVKHVEETHKSGSKFQCIYCGKDFQSMPNMKKHVRFHLGYRATCRVCSEAFSNVGALRKHTRVSHPDIYRARLIERLEKYGVLKGPDKNALSKELIEKINSNRKNQQESKENSDTVESDKKEVKEEKVDKNIEKEEDIDHEINFTADEIDDGGSRFKFACTVCKKRFSSYINMCRHRRKVHSNENRNRTEQCLTFGRKPRNNPSPVLENPAEIAAFYANISHNIATNLNCYIDGKPESLKTFVDHIKVEGYPGNFGYSDEDNKPLDLTWEKYNFPHSYKPVQTISFADIKNVHNIHNDFESHCVSVDARIVESEKQEQIPTADVKETTTGIESEKCLSDSKEKVNRCSTDTGSLSEESIEDLEVREINSASKSKDFKSVKEAEDSSEFVESDTMGKSSHGLKVLANLGTVLSKKGGASSSGEKDFEHKVHQKLKVTNRSESPAAKTFHQVKLGEYANFQDDLLSCDMDCTVTKATQQAGHAHNWKKWQCIENSEDGTLNELQETKDLVKEARDELDTLYDNIDDCDPVTKVIKMSPKSLSTLCEEILGLNPHANEHRSNISLNDEVASELKLSASESKGSSKSPFVDSGPDFSDATEESPFYNYESIAFGTNGNIEQVCAICRKHFPDFDTLLRHHTKKHPASECSVLEVEKGHEIEDLHFSDPSSVGALAVTDPGLDNISELESYKCTNCDASFKTVSKLHIHIVNCSSIDPLYGVRKADSPTKTPLKRKLQKRIFNMFGNKTDEKTDSTVTHFKLSQQRNDTQSPKRVFTGCRKRTSVILPDSPQKLVCEQRQSVPNVSGYNPQNHIRRRELTEILDTLTCKACGMKFKTIIILERHIKYCTKKEKFKSIQPMACPLIDESLEKIKNMCFYCNKNFTYTKSLLNHFQDFCPVKKAKLDKGELTEEDKVREQGIIERIQKAEEEKSLKQKEMENRPKRNMTWQVGRKSKRKGHSWTNIKKRSQPKLSHAGNANAEGSEENEESDSSESEEEPEDNPINAKCSDSNGDSSKVEETSDNFESERPEHSNTADADTSEDEKICSEYENSEDAHISLPSEKTFENEDKQTLNSCSALPDKNATVAVFTIQKEMTSHEIPTTVPLKADVMSSVEHTRQDSINQLVAMNEDVKFDTEVMNTSLNCTARYNVNQIKAVSKYRPIAPKPKASSVIFQCVSKQLTDSKQMSLDGKMELEKDKKFTDQICNEARPAGFCISSRSICGIDPARTNEEALFQLAQKGLVTGKRKRARVGRVEEFLRNAFKRKRKKCEGQEEKSATSSLISGSISLLQSKNDVKIINVNSGNSSEKAGPVDQRVISETSNVEQPEIKSNENDQGTFDGSVVIKRKRGRPRLSENRVKVPSTIVPGRKRGRPKKVLLIEPSPNTGTFVDSSPSVVDNYCDSLEKEEETADWSVMSEGHDTVKHNTNHSGKTKEQGHEIGVDNMDKVDNLESKTDSEINNDSINENTAVRNSEESRLSSGGYNLISDITNIVTAEANDDSDKTDYTCGACNEHEPDGETVEFSTDPAKERKSTVNDVNNFINHTSFIISNENGESPTKPVIQSNHLDKNGLSSKLKVNQSLEHTLLELHNTPNISNGSCFDEVDGNFPTIATENHESEDNLASVEKALETPKDKTETISFSEQVSDVCSHNSEIEDVLLPIDNSSNTGKNNTILPSVVEPVQEVKENMLTDNALRSETNTGFELQCVQKSSNQYAELVSDETNFDSVNDTEKVGRKSAEQIISDNETVDPELKSGEYDASSFSSVYEPFLSPSERVKMNRRSCKKDVDLASPVWVKRTKLNKTKIEKKIDVCKKGTHVEHGPQDTCQVIYKHTCSYNAAERSESVKIDSVAFKNKKRKVAELDDRTNCVSIDSEQVPVQGILKNAKMK